MNSQRSEMQTPITRRARSLARLSTRLVTLAAALMILVAACGGESTETTNPSGDSTTTSGPTTTAAGTSTAPVSTSVTTTTATATSEPPPDEFALGLSTGGDFGTHLVDGAGRTLYMFLADEQGPSTCYDACAESWPPLTSNVTAGTDVDASLLGTTEREDGTAQVTYNGWPLYYYAMDREPGDANGQGAASAWFIVDPQGNPVGQAS